MAEPKTDTQELKAYFDAKWQLIPLHKWDAVDSPGGTARNRGKSPRDNNWTRRPYRNADQKKHMKAGFNVGVRLRADDLVLDVDPRNFDEGDDPLARLCEDCGLDLSDYPAVETGSGGWHYYMKKPDDISTRDSIKEYEGLEYKTLGRQVVSAGSIHPTAKKKYEWDFLSPELKDAPMAPERLINMIRRPVMIASENGGGEYDQEKLAEMLDELDVLDFGDHDAWFTLMQACHHATNGDGRSEFIDWSTGDPSYGDDGGAIGRRWDSLHSDNGDGTENRVTYKTLNKALIDAGKESVIPRTSAADDFPDEGDREEEDLARSMELGDHEKLSPLERLNTKFYAVTDRGKFQVMWEEVDYESGDPVNGIPDRKVWVRSAAHDFKNMLGHKYIQRKNKKGELVRIPIAEDWLVWPKRRSVTSVVFSPERNVPNALNLWTGWGHKPEKNASWDRLKELLFEVLSDGDQRVFDYIMNWSAYMIQHPGSPAEVAICFQGGKGVGKGTWGRTLTSLAGTHGMQVTSSDQLTGRFNDHLRNLILLFADEAISPYDKAGESRLKALITEPMMAYEGKGANIVNGKNRLHVCMASNDDWFVPVGMQAERRFMVQQANTKWQGKHSKFDKLNAELAAGGYSRLLWDLMHRDIVGWSPRKDVPTTSAALDQKLRGMAPMEQWWFNILTSGDIPFEGVDDEQDWATGKAAVFKSDLMDDFGDFARKINLKNPYSMGKSNIMVFAKDLKKLIPNLETGVAPVPEDRIDVNVRKDGRANTFVIPPLKACRDDMAGILGNEVNWTS